MNDGHLNNVQVDIGFRLKKNILRYNLNRHLLILWSLRHFPNQSDNYKTFLLQIAAHFPLETAHICITETKQLH